MIANEKLLQLKPLRYRCPLCGEWHKWAPMKRRWNSWCAIEKTELREFAGGLDGNVAALICLESVNRYRVNWNWKNIDSKNEKKQEEFVIPRTAKASNIFFRNGKCYYAVNICDYLDNGQCIGEIKFEDMKVEVGNAGSLEDKEGGRRSKRYIENFKSKGVIRERCFHDKEYAESRKKEVYKITFAYPLNCKTYIDRVVKDIINENDEEKHKNSFFKKNCTKCSIARKCSIRNGRDHLIAGCFVLIKFGFEFDYDEAMKVLK